MLLSSHQRPAPALFTGISWSTPAVLQQTLALLHGQSIEGHLLPFWYDIDQAGDLERLVWHARALRAAQPGALPHTWDALTRTGLVSGAQEQAA